MTQKNYGSKRLVVGAHYGLRDWMAQRATSALMAIFTVVLLAQVLFGGPMGYERWAGIFSSQWMRLFTFIVILALTYHVWVGVRNIWMDYVKPAGLKLALQVVAIAWLLGCAGWALQVLWRL